jgi:transcriptional regulator with XRE-family HTH domain
MTDPTEHNRIEFGKRLRQARLNAKLTQGELSEATGVNIGHISEIERGLQNITLNTMTVLAKAVGMDIELDLIPEKPKPGRRKKAP